MVDVIQIPNLPAATSLSGAEQYEIVQAGVSRRTTTDQIAGFVQDELVFPVVYTTFPTFVGMAALNIDLSTGMSFQTQGYYTPGDGGDARYVVTSVPYAGVNASRVSGVTFNGRYFKQVYDGTPLKLEQAGGIADGSYSAPTGTDNMPAFLALLGLYSTPTRVDFAGGPQFLFPPKTYFFSTNFELKKTVYWRGSKGGTDWHANGTLFTFPADCIGVTINSTDTLNGGVVSPPTTSASGSVIEGIHFKSFGGTDKTKHGIYIRSPVSMRDCVVENFAGNGFNNVAGFSQPGANRGNTSNTYIEKCVVRDAGGHGFYTAINDANVCTYNACRAFGQIKGCAFKDVNTFGNVYLTCEADFYGGNGLGTCSYGGYNYLLISDTVGIGAATTPGTNNTIWYNTGVAATAPAWDPGVAYEVAMPYYFDGASNASCVIGAYSEGGLSHAIYTTIVTPGLASFTSYSNCMKSGGSSLSTSITTGNGIGAIGKPIPGSSDYTTLGENVAVIVGDYASTGTMWRAHANAEVAGVSGWITRFDGLDLSMGTGIKFGTNYVPILGLSPLVAQAKYNFGNPVPIASTAYTRAIAIGDNSATFNNARRVYNATSIPTTGTFAQGDIILNRSAASNVALGWVCTTTGSITATAWAAGSFTIGQIRLNGGTVYVCTTAGTSIAPGPSGTGTNISDGGTCLWASTVPFVLNLIPSSVPVPNTAAVAAGASQAGATLLLPGISVVTSGSGGVRLPLAPTGGVTSATILNTSGGSINVYPSAGLSINALGLNNPTTLADGAAVSFIAASSTLWVMV